MKQPAAWSEELRKLTRQKLQSGDIWPGPDGYVHFKHIDDRFGGVTLADSLRNNWAIVDLASQQTTHFKTIDDLIASGWALD